MCVWQQFAFSRHPTNEWLPWVYDWANELNQMAANRSRRRAESLMLGSFGIHTCSPSEPEKPTIK